MLINYLVVLLNGAAIIGVAMQSLIVRATYGHTANTVARYTIGMWSCVMI